MQSNPSRSVHLSNARQRAMLKLLTVMAAITMLLLLGCGMISPLPPLRYTFIDEPQPALAPGETRRFTVRVFDTLNQQVAAYSRFEIWQNIYRSGQGHSENILLTTVQSDPKGEFTFALTLPDGLTVNDSASLTFRPLDESNQQDFYQNIGIKEGLVIAFKNWPQRAFAGETLELSGQVIDNQDQQPAIGAVVTVTHPPDTLRQCHAQTGCGQGDSGTNG